MCWFSCSMCMHHERPLVCSMLAIVRTCVCEFADAYVHIRVAYVHIRGTYADTYVYVCRHVCVRVQHVCVRMHTRTYLARMHTVARMHTCHVCMPYAARMCTYAPSTYAANPFLVAPRMHTCCTRHAHVARMHDVCGSSNNLYHSVARLVLTRDK